MFYRSLLIFVVSFVVVCDGCLAVGSDGEAAAAFEERETLEVSRKNGQQFQGYAVPEIQAAISELDEIISDRQRVWKN